MRFLLPAACAVLLLIHPSAVGAEDASCAGNTALRKLGRGCANVVSCPIEIYNQMDRAHCEGGPAAAFTWGLVKGIGMTGARVAAGVYEIATFPFPAPAVGRPVMTDPELFFKDSEF